MNQAEVICTLLIVVATLAILAKKVDVPYPVLLVIGGLALGFVPGLPAVQLEPELVFLFLLPPMTLSGCGLYFLARFSRKPEPHLAPRHRACLVNDRVRGRRHACADWFALAGGVCSGRNYFAAGRCCSDGDHEPHARAAKNRHRLGWRESPQ